MPIADPRRGGLLGQASILTLTANGVDTSPVIRGVWMGPHASEAEYRQWVATFDRVLASPQFAQMRAASGLYPFGLTGDALAAYVKKAVDDYGKRAAELGLVR